MKNLPHLLVMALVGLSGPALAASVSYSDALDFAATDWNRTLQLRRFDPGMGTLTGVSIDFGGVMRSAFSAENFSATPYNLGNRVAGSMVFALPVGVPRTLAFAAEMFHPLPVNGSYDAFVVDAGNAAQTVAGASDLGLFYGVTPLSVSVSALGHSRMDGPGNVDTLVLSDAMANLRVTYQYASTAAFVAVPEPASLALLGLMLAVAGLAGRRRGG